MHWLYEWQKQTPPRLSEKSVDCGACRVLPPLKRNNTYNAETKCCEFSPFLSCFAIGQLIREGKNMAIFFQQAQGDLIATHLGLIHSHSHRKEEGRLCSFFDSSSKGCQIWTQRPATCFCFFCVSESSGRWDALEMELLEKEAGLLKRWFFEKGGSSEDWAQWGLVMEQDPIVAIPPSMIFESWAEAERCYLESRTWLDQQSHSSSA